MINLMNKLWDKVFEQAQAIIASDFFEQVHSMQWNYVCQDQTRQF